MIWGSKEVVLMPVEVGVVLIGAGFAVAVSLVVAVWFERWKAKQPDPDGHAPIKKPRQGGA